MLYLIVIAVNHNKWNSNPESYSRVT